MSDLKKISVFHKITTFVSCPVTLPQQPPEGKLSLKNKKSNTDPENSAEQFYLMSHNPGLICSFVFVISTTVTH